MMITLAICCLLIYWVVTRVRRTLSEIAGFPTQAGNPQANPQTAAPAFDLSDAKEMESPYFTYESLNPDDYSMTVSPKMQTSIDQVQTEVRDLTDATFDLRQAVVYQCILHNPYSFEAR